ncbi:MAG: flagellar biosynthetic protein FliO [Pseudomonadota bacterium]
MLHSALVLAAVCAVAWLIIGVGIRRIAGLRGDGNRDVLRLVARLPLEPKRAVYVVEAAGKMLLLGSSEQGPLTLLGELDAVAVKSSLQEKNKVQGTGEVERLPKRMTTFAEAIRRKLGGPSRVVREHAAESDPQPFDQQSNPQSGRAPSQSSG